MILLLAGLVTVLVILGVAAWHSRRVTAIYADDRRKTAAMYDHYSGHPKGLERDCEVCR